MGTVIPPNGFLSFLPLSLPLYLDEMELGLSKDAEALREKGEGGEKGRGGGGRGHSSSLSVENLHFSLCGLRRGRKEEGFFLYL